MEILNFDMRWSTIFVRSAGFLDGLCNLVTQTGHKSMGHLFVRVVSSIGIED
jgi:hypothetical protein